MAPFAFRRGALGPLLATWRWVTFYTVVEIAVPWLLLFHAEQRISSSLAGLLVAAVRSSARSSTASRARPSDSTRGG